MVGASLVAQLVKNLPAVWRPGFDLWVGKIPWRREWLPTPVFWPGEFYDLYRPWGCKESEMAERLSLSFPVVGASQVALVVKNPPAKAGDMSPHD